MELLLLLLLLLLMLVVLVVEEEGGGVSSSSSMSRPAIPALRGGLGRAAGLLELARAEEGGVETQVVGGGEERMGDSPLAGGGRWGWCCWRGPGMLSPLQLLLLPPPYKKLSRSSPPADDDALTGPWDGDGGANAEALPLPPPSPAPLLP